MLRSSVQGALTLGQGLGSGLRTAWQAANAARVNVHEPMVFDSPASPTTVRPATLPEPLPVDDEGQQLEELRRVSAQAQARIMEIEGRQSGMHTPMQESAEQTADSRPADGLNVRAGQSAEQDRDLSPAQEQQVQQRGVERVPAEAL